MRKYDGFREDAQITGNSNFFEYDKHYPTLVFISKRASDGMDFVRRTGEAADYYRARSETSRENF